MDLHLNSTGLNPILRLGSLQNLNVCLLYPSPPLTLFDAINPVRTRIKHCSLPDSDDDSTVDTASESDAPQDGCGDPNLSSISPPIPKALVKPKLQGFEMGFHVITMGTEVGISVFKCIIFLCNSFLPDTL